MHIEEEKYIHLERSYIKKLIFFSAPHDVGILGKQ